MTGSKMAAPKQQKPGETKKQQQRQTSTTKSRSSIWNRKLDIVYLAFFVIHIPIMFCTISCFFVPLLLVSALLWIFAFDIHLYKNGRQRKDDQSAQQQQLTHLSLYSLGADLVPFYPESVTPDVLVRLREFYISTYADKFATEPTIWFTAYTAMEALYHVPLSIWAVRGLWRGVYYIPFLMLSLALFSLALGAVKYI